MWVNVTLGTVSLVSVSLGHTGHELGALEWMFVVAVRFAGTIVPVHHGIFTLICANDWSKIWGISFLVGCAQANCRGQEKQNLETHLGNLVR